MTSAHDPAKAVRARIVGEWSSPDLITFGPLLPSAGMDVLRILGANGSVGAMVLRRLLFLIHDEHKTLEGVLEDLVRPNVPVTIEGMTAALVEAIMDPMTGANILPVSADTDPENWDAVRSARLFLEHGV